MKAVTDLVGIRKLAKQFLWRDVSHDQSKFSHVASQGSTFTYGQVSSIMVLTPVHTRVAFSKQFQGLIVDLEWFSTLVKM